MIYKIAICDDSKTDSDYICNLLKVWAKNRDILIQVECFSSAEAFLFNYEEDKTYNLLLLDIEMGDMDGVTMAKQIRKENDSVQIIFITGYSDYIAEGYEVAALHYLMKPVNEEKLYSVLNRATDKIIQNEQCINLLLSGEMIRIPLYKIRYLDVQKNYVTVHCKDEYTIKRSLGEFEKLLDNRFFRVVRGMIINLEYISRVTKTDVYLSDGTILPLPRGIYDSLNRAIITHT